jgi:DNA polymerase
LGSGVPDATWMLVGDGPDAQDESAGQAFTGQTGLLLDNIMHAVDAGRKHNVYLTTLVKCRAQDASGLARAPEPEEIAACRPFLQRQIALLQPQLVVSLGKLAAQALRQPGAGPLRGVVHKLAADLCRDVPTPPALIASWHPAIVLQQPLEKRQVWADLCLAQQTLTPRAAASVGDDDIPF